MPVPRTTAVNGSLATCTGTPSMRERSSGKPRSKAPPPNTVTPLLKHVGEELRRRMLDDVLHGFHKGIERRSQGLAHVRVGQHDFPRQAGGKVAAAYGALQRLLERQHGADAYLGGLGRGLAIASWNSLRTKSMMFSLKRSPATCELLLATLPPSEEHGDVGRACADIEHHGAHRLIDRKLGADGARDRLFQYVYFARTSREAPHRAPRGSRRWSPP